MGIPQLPARRLHAHLLRLQIVDAELDRLERANGCGRLRWADAERLFYFLLNIAGPLLS